MSLLLLSMNFVKVLVKLLDIYQLWWMFMKISLNYSNVHLDNKIFQPSPYNSLPIKDLKKVLVNLLEFHLIVNKIWANHPNSWNQKVFQPTPNNSSCQFKSTALKMCQQRALLRGISIEWPCKLVGPVCHHFPAFKLAGKHTHTSTHTNSSIIHIEIQRDIFITGRKLANKYSNTKALNCK